MALWIDQGTVAHFRNLTVKLDLDGKRQRALHGYFARALVLTLAVTHVGAQETAETKKLKPWSSEFDRGIVEITSTQAESIPPDSPRWQLEGKAKATEYLGRRCLWLQDGRAR